MEHKLEVDVHAHWSDIPPIYRLYVNDEMLTERTFSHVSYQFYITEHIICNLDTGVHCLKLESVTSDAKFELDNLVIDQKPMTKSLLKKNDNNYEWRFIIDNLLNNPPIIRIGLETISHPNPPIDHANLRKQVQPKKYTTTLPLTQKMRELNNRAVKK